MRDYEDTIMGEEGRCEHCGVRVDEGDNYGEDATWVCEDCHDERAEDEDEDEDVSISRTDWLAVAADITGVAAPTSPKDKPQ